MTGGSVVLLGETGGNIGAGMTGGEVYIPKRNFSQLNVESVFGRGLRDDEVLELIGLLTVYEGMTGSARARRLLDSESYLRDHYGICLPIPKKLTKLEKAA